MIISFFAAWLPDFEFIFGMEQGRISSMLVFGTFNGFLLGPIVGPIVTIVAMLLHLPINPEYLGNNLFTYLSPGFIGLASIIAGLCVAEKQKFAYSIFGAVILLWFITPVGFQAYSYIWFHVLVLACCVLASRKQAFYHVSRRWQIFVYLFLVSLLAVLADHLIGSIIAAFVFDLDANVYKEVIYLYPLERLILAFSAAVFGYIVFMLVQVLTSENIRDRKEPFTDVKDIVDYIETDVKAILHKERK
ncbi:hypothetical protein [Methanohalophilus sp.]|uniref:hypothetical protein n=1 Tax=Methanohalophilus sp. TaxID=1966352 RepID=UPI00261204C1|nr:hypothetical protein [Methanohalophilus sp.]